MSNVNCIDVSYCQTNVNYEKVKKSGIGSVIIRAGFGREVSQKDSEFERHYKNAKAAGMKIGVYWYSYANGVNDAKTEANACLKCLAGKKLDLPVYFDMEESKQTSYGKTTLTNMAIAFCNTIIAGGYKAGVYSNLNWFNNFLDYNKLKSKYSIWLAQWSSSPSKSCDIWQNADNGRVNGVSSLVDTNVIYNKNLSGSSNTSASKPSAGTNVSATSRKSAIKTVQKWVGATQDGVYGSNTKKCLIKKLQSELNNQFCLKLAVDGIFGANTKSAVASHATLSLGMTGNITKVLQGLLICNGYSTGGFDGVFGNSTKSAVKSYQSKHGLVSDGIAGANTFAKLCM